MKTLHIFPCFDNLLYFPVYLALDTMEDDDGILGRSSGYMDPGYNVRREWQFNNYTVVLEPHEKGDATAINRVAEFKHEPDHCALAICDPMIALLHNGSLKEEDPSRLQILATFLDRVALWGVAASPPGSSASTKNKRSRLRSLLTGDTSDQLRDLPELLKKMRVAYCKFGFTTAYVLAHYLHAEIELVDKGDERKGYILKPNKNCTVDFVSQDDFGEEEIGAIFQESDPCDVVFTNTPWLAEPLKELKYKGSDRVLMSPYCKFPLSPFPFSSVVTTTEGTKQADISFKGAARAGMAVPDPISPFLRHLLIAIAIAYRTPLRAAQRLRQVADRYRYFGMDEKLVTEDTIFHGVNEMSFHGFLSDQLSNSWMAWSHAFRVRNPGYDEGKFFNLWNLTIKNDYVLKYRGEVTIELRKRLQRVSDSFLNKVRRSVPPRPGDDSVDVQPAEPMS